MKKSLIIGMLGMAVLATQTYGQGFIALDNYDSTASPLVTYGPNTGGTVGTGINTAGWTVGIYFAQGGVAGSVGADATGTADPSTLGGGLALASGPGSTAAIYTSTFNTPGKFFTPNTFQASAAVGSTITLEVVAYNGANYLSSGMRGHSTAFTMTTAAGNAPTPNFVGDSMPTFSVFVVPEPSVFALAGLGGAFLMMIRRKK